MISLEDSLVQLKKDPSFKRWKKENPDSYMCHCLKMISDEDSWHIGFYNPDDSIMTFIVSSDEILMDHQKEIFKDPDTKIKPLIESDIVVPSSKAIEQAEELSKKKYAREVVSKKIIILQSLEIGQVYNITFVTTAMNTLNFKIDSSSGELLHENKSSLMDLRAQGSY